MGKSGEFLRADECRAEEDEHKERDQEAQERVRLHEGRHDDHASCKFLVLRKHVHTGATDLRLVRRGCQTGERNRETGGEERQALPHREDHVAGHHFTVEHDDEQERDHHSVEPLGTREHHEGDHADSSPSPLLTDANLTTVCDLPFLI